MSRILLVLLAAGLYALPFPPLGLWPLAGLALAPFFAALARSGPAAGAGLGLLFGVAATAGVTWWFPGMLRGYFGLSPAASVLALLALGVGMVGIHTAAFGAWLGWVAGRGRAGPLVVAAGFVAAELTRSHGPLAAPWALAGYALAGTPWAQTADLGGPAVPGFLLAVANAALAGLFVPALRPAGARRGAALAAGLALAGAGYGAWRLAGPPAGGSPLRVAVVQGGMTWSYAFDPAESAPHLARYLSLTSQAAAGRPDLVFWPEHAIDFYLRDPGPERSELLGTLARLGVDVVLGAPHHLGERGSPAFRNSVFAVEGGRVADRVDKARLVPFAEVAPFPGGPAAGERPYQAGGPRRPLRTRAARLGVLICSEGLFPGAARELVRAGADLLVHPSNDFWMRSASAAELMLRSAAFRAIETRRFLVRATPTGVSALVDPEGRVVGRAPYGEAALLAGEVWPASGTTLFVRIGELPAVLAAVLAIAAAVLPARPARPRAVRS
jgi:apolipoprotein N-acyltransferase